MDNHIIIHFSCDGAAEGEYESRQSAYAKRLGRGAARWVEIFDNSTKFYVWYFWGGSAKKKERWEHELVNEVMN